MLNSIFLLVSTQVQQEAGLEVDPEEYCASFSTDMAHVCLRWCSGDTFAQV
jgi:hypothetical protein